MVWIALQDGIESVDHLLGTGLRGAPGPAVQLPPVEPHLAVHPEERGNRVAGMRGADRRKGLDAGSLGAFAGLDTRSEGHDVVGLALRRGGQVLTCGLEGPARKAQ